MEVLLNSHCSIERAFRIQADGRIAVRSRILGRVPAKKAGAGFSSVGLDWGVRYWELKGLASYEAGLRALYANCDIALNIQDTPFTLLAKGVWPLTRPTDKQVENLVKDGYAVLLGGLHDGHSVAFEPPTLEEMPVRNRLVLQSLDGKTPPVQVNLQRLHFEEETVEELFLESEIGAVVRPHACPDMVWRPNRKVWDVQPGDTVKVPLFSDSLEIGRPYSFAASVDGCLLGITVTMVEDDARDDYLLRIDEIKEG